MNQTPLALVTGATSGIGEQFAVEYARRGHDLILVARREAELQTLADKLAKTHGSRVTVRPCDLGDATARAAFLDELAEQGTRVDVLVNNAGYGDVGEFATADPAKTSGMIELNCQAVVELTQALLPGMLRRERGTIINVASTAAFQPLPTMAVYAATKAFVKSFTEALATELRPTAVRAIAICPGPTDTAFFAVAGADDVMTQRRTPAQVVETTMAGLDRGKTVVVDGAANAVGATLGKVMPRRVTDVVAARVLRHQD